MGFNVKHIFRKSSGKQGSKPQQTDTDSPSDDDAYSHANQRNNHPQRLVPQNTEPHASHTKNIRKKASWIVRSKDSGGYFNSLSGAAPSGSSNNVEAKLDTLFDELRDAGEDAKDAMGVESTMHYLTSLGLNPESGEIFVALELVQAPNFGEITRKGFVDGWKNTGAAATVEGQAKYVSRLVRQFSTDAAYFKRVYRYTFVAGKEESQRSMSLENAIEFWRVLFARPGRPWQSASQNWIDLWIQFLQDKWTRSVNRDMWNQTLEFATKSMQDETLSFWNEDGAWPSVIDDFVAWCHTRGVASKDAMQTDS